MFSTWMLFNGISRYIYRQCITIHIQNEGTRVKMLIQWERWRNHLLLCCRITCFLFYMAGRISTESMHMKSPYFCTCSLRSWHMMHFYLHQVGSQKHLHPTQTPPPSSGLLIILRSGRELCKSGNLCVMRWEERSRGDPGQIKVTEHLWGPFLGVSCQQERLWIIKPWGNKGWVARLRWTFTGHTLAFISHRNKIYLQRIQPEQYSRPCRTSW